MQKVLLVLSSVVFSAAFFCSIAQAQKSLSLNIATGNNVREVKFAFPEPDSEIAAPSSQIKDVQVFGEQSGIAFTRDTLFRTDDNGATWREIALPKNYSEIISAVSFLNETVGWIVLADQKFARLEIAKTNDGGNSWTRTPMNLRQEDLLEANLDKVEVVAAYSNEYPYGNWLVKNLSGFEFKFL